MLGALYFVGSPASSMIVATDVSDGDMLAVLRPCLLSESSWLGRHFPLFDLAPRSCVRTLIRWTLLNQEQYDGLCQLVKSELRDRLRR